MNCFEGNLTQNSFHLDRRIIDIFWIPPPVIIGDPRNTKKMTSRGERWGLKRLPWTFYIIIALWSIKSQFYHGGMNGLLLSAKYAVIQILGFCNLASPSLKRATRKGPYRAYGKSPILMKDGRREVSALVFPIHHRPPGVFWNLSSRKRCSEISSENCCWGIFTWNHF